MAAVFRDVEVVRMAQRIRAAREKLSEVSAALVDLYGDSELLVQLTNIECELSEIYLDLMQTVSKCPPAPPPRRNRERGQLRL